MATEHVEAARRAVEAWNSGDLEAFLEVGHPEVEWRPALPAGVEGIGGVYKGRDEIGGFWREFREMFVDFKIDVEDVLEVGNEHVLTLGHIYGRTQNGFPVDSPWASLAEFRDGLWFSSREFMNQQAHEEGRRAAAGLA
jgi:ketosteroid isomerase-like protein